MRESPSEQSFDLFTTPQDTMLEHMSNPPPSTSAPEQDTTSNNPETAATTSTTTPHDQASLEHQEQCHTQSLDHPTNSTSTPCQIYHELTHTLATDLAAECPICTEAFGYSGQLLTRNQCDHVFHEPCLLKWLAMGQKTCPLCRGSISRVAGGDVEEDDGDDGEEYFVHGDEVYFRDDDDENHDTEVDGVTMLTLMAYMVVMAANARARGRTGWD